MENDHRKYFMINLHENMGLGHNPRICMTALQGSIEHRPRFWIFQHYFSALSRRTGPKVIKLFSCWTQMSTKFIPLINVKMPTIVGILTFISMINTTSERLKARNFFICWYFSFYTRLKFGAQMSWVRNKKRYDSELPYQRPDLIEVMEIEIDLTTSTNVHTGFYISVRECLDWWRNGVKAYTNCYYCVPVVTVSQASYNSNYR